MFKGHIDANDVLGAMGAMIATAGFGVIWCVSTLIRILLVCLRTRRPGSQHIFRSLVPPFYTGVHHRLGMPRTVRERPPPREQASPVFARAWPIIAAA